MAHHTSIAKTECPAFARFEAAAIARTTQFVTILIAATHMLFRLSRAAIGVLAVILFFWKKYYYIYFSWCFFTEIEHLQF